MRRRTWFAVGAAAVVVTAGLVVLLFPVSGPRTTATASACAGAAADHAAALRAPVSPGTPGLVVVLGDSYSQGAGLPQGRRAAFPALLARATGRPVHLDGFGSTGFTTPGFCSDRPVAYAERLGPDGVLALRPTTVIVEGGVNDARHGRPDAVRAAADDLLRRLAAVPQVIVLGPADVPAGDPGRLATVDAALAAAAETAGRPYVDLRQQRIALQPDRIHPTAAGQAAIAALLVPLVESPVPRA